MTIITREPALTMGFLQALVALVTVFGARFSFELSQGEQASILVFAAALLSLATRQMVTPKGSK